jgi:hypothetical protein
MIKSINQSINQLVALNGHQIKWGVARVDGNG